MLSQASRKNLEGCQFWLIEIVVANALEALIVIVAQISSDSSPHQKSLFPSSPSFCQF
jgi:hypothetical protein